MKITPEMLSIAPYIVAQWSDILSIHQDEDLRLIIDLCSDHSVFIPDLSLDDKQKVFDAFGEFLEKQAPIQEAISLHQANPMGSLQEGQGNIAFQQPIFSAGFPQIEGMVGNVFEHDPKQMHAPEMPPELLNKIAAITRVIAPGELDELPKPEPHCNCPHCQITRSIHSPITSESSAQVSKSVKEEIVTDEDLKFRSWDIEQIGEKLFLVKNPLDENEQYNVCIGKDMGCTCGEKNCEHIRSVLLS